MHEESPTGAPASERVQDAGVLLSVAALLSALIGRRMPSLEHSRDRRGRLASTMAVTGVLLATIQFFVQVFELLGKVMAPLFKVLPYIIVTLVTPGILALLPFIRITPRESVPISRCFARQAPISRTPPWPRICLRSTYISRPGIARLPTSCSSPWGWRAMRRPTTQPPSRFWTPPSKPSRRTRRSVPKAPTYRANAKLYSGDAAASIIADLETALRLKPSLAEARNNLAIVDLNSRNGTYVNKQRIAGSVSLQPGDVVQLGPGGPEFQFDLDPLPAHLVRATRIAGMPAGAIPATRLSDLPPSVAPPTGASPPPIGKATVERMVGQAKTETRKSMVLVGAGTLAVVVLVAAVLFYMWTQLNRQVSDQAQQQKERAWTPAEIAAKFTESTIFIEVGWKLIFTETGEQVYHEYHVQADSQGKPLQDDRGRPRPPIPVHIQLPNGKIEPSLALGRGNSGQNQPIGTQHAGSGFAVTSDGFILTNRHVAATWETSYPGFPPGPGLLVKLGSDQVSQLDRPPSDWVPAAARVLGRRPIVGKNIEGRLDYLDVTFAKNKLRIPAKLVRVSDRHDVAMIKVDVPQPVTKVELYDNYDAIKPGVAITVMGYPGASPLTTVVSRSQDVFSREDQRRTVPDPTVSPGTIGRILRGQVRPIGGQEYDYWSEYGDAYQLDTSTTGQGNSGGPVFDDHGRVIGILYAGRAGGGALLSFAVPIRYGIELMGIGATIK